MQKYFSTLLIFVISTMSLFSQQSEIVIKGTVEFPVDGVDIKISHINSKGKVFINSIVVNPDKTFKKTISIPEPGVYEIDCQGLEKLEFWGENENIEINFRGQDTARIRGMSRPYLHIESAGENNELMNLIRYSDYRTFQTGLTAIRDMKASQESECEEWEKRVANSYREAIDVGDANIDYLAQYYQNRNSIIALLPRIKSEKIKEEVMEYLVENKSDYPPFVKYKKEIDDTKASLEKVAIGATAPGFSFIFSNGEKGESLKSFKGKYLLVDFWASWCGPCRKSIPALKELYKQYHSKDFEILSISVDSEKSNWMKALNEENMPWTQLFTEDVGKEVMQKYQFGFIPFLVLIDKEGRILERGISMEDLKKRLKEVL